MGFDDLARHMRARDGGKLSKASHPDEMMVDAVRAARRMQIRRDLILGPIMIVGGAIVTAASVFLSSNASLGYSYYVVPAVGAVGIGVVKLGRGLSGLLWG